MCINSTNYRSPFAGPLGSLNEEESDTGGNSSESECVLSDPCNYLTHEDDGLSPERKVSFVHTESSDKFDVEGLKDKKKRWVVNF